MTPWIKIEDLEFKEIGHYADGGAKIDLLLATIQIGPKLFHVEAHRVYMEDGHQIAPINDDDLVAIARIVGADAPFETVRIGDFDYVLIITPFCE